MLEVLCDIFLFCIFFFKQKTAYEMRISDWSSDVCSSDLLDWDAIPGLSETLGKNGVTSNYRYDLAPYTHRLVKDLKSGRALFTQPPMPIKCAGAPQKAMYLSCNDWERSGVLKDIAVQFHNSGADRKGVV